MLLFHYVICRKDTVVSLIFQNEKVFYSGEEDYWAVYTGMNLCRWLKCLALQHSCLEEGKLLSTVQNVIILQWDCNDIRNYKLHSCLKSSFPKVICFFFFINWWLTPKVLVTSLHALIIFSMFAVNLPSTTWRKNENFHEGRIQFLDCSNFFSISNNRLT